MGKNSDWAAIYSKYFADENSIESRRTPGKFNCEFNSKNARFIGLSPKQGIYIRLYYIVIYI